MARGDYPSAKQDQFMVRFPDGMRDRIKAAADANNRSMNAEIVARLEENARLQTRQTSLSDEVEELTFQLDEKDAQIKRMTDREIEHLAEIRVLRQAKHEFDKEIEAREAEIVELRAILRNYAAHAEGLEKLEEQLSLLSARLPTISERGDAQINAIADALNDGNVEDAIRALGVEPSAFRAFEEAMKRAAEFPSRAATKVNEGGDK